MTIRTSHQWIAQLTAQSTAIAAMQLNRRIKNADLDTDAFKLANDPAHTDLIVRAVEALLIMQASTEQDASTLLTDIICRDTYGKFSELAAYDWLMRCRLKITTQTRNAPFILMFVIHPWLNECAIFNNFAGNDIAFARAFARRAFMQFTHDFQPLNTICKEVGPSITVSDAAKLLSAIIFVNAWPDGHKLDRETMPSAVYLNPHASHPIGYRASLFRSINPNILIEDFANDNY